MQRRRRRLAGVAGFGGFTFGLVQLFQPTVVVGDSMAPTLRDGRVILLDRFHYRSHAPRSGEVVVFKREGLTCIKRVYRGPGEMVHFLHRKGEVEVPTLVDGRKLEEVRRRYSHPGSYLRLMSLRVPDDCLYVLGDNLVHSQDSRHFGPIPCSSLLGRARMEPDQSIFRQAEVRPAPPPRLAHR